MTYFANGKDTVGYVTDLLRHSEFDFPSTMTITPEKSGGYSVQIVTDTSSADTDENLVVSNFFNTQVNT